MGRFGQHAALICLLVCLLVTGSLWAQAPPQAAGSYPQPNLPFEVPPPPIAIPAATPVESESAEAEPAPWLDFLLSESAPLSTPRVAAPPLLGNAPIEPVGRGYYSLLEKLRGHRRVMPPVYAYPAFGLPLTPFFETDFSYLDDPDYRERDAWDIFKRLPVGNQLMASFGGEARSRYMNEYNSRLTDSDNIYLLNQTRLYGDFWYSERFRTYIELITAYSYWEDLRSFPEDENKLDLQNLFIDMRLFDWRGQPAYLRFGRQELGFGSQRLVSPDYWRNAPRTFQGVRGYHRTDLLDLDMFWARPVYPNPGQFDLVDERTHFAGVWGSMRFTPELVADLYYLMLHDNNRYGDFGLTLAPFTVHTVGTRSAGVSGNWLWDVETALQFGRVDEQDLFAGMLTSGLGFHVPRAKWNPTFWIYYDFASGDRNPNGQRTTTFNQLYAYGHHYLGWADRVGRQNIHDLNMHFYLYPSNWLTCWLQYHQFWLASPFDALYDAQGRPYRRDATGQAGVDVGTELDLVMNFHLTRHADLLTGYSFLFGGDFLKRTAGPGEATNTSLFFMQLSYRW